MDNVLLYFYMALTMVKKQQPSIYIKGIVLVFQFITRKSFSPIFFSPYHLFFFLYFDIRFKGVFFLCRNINVFSSYFRSIKIMNTICLCFLRLSAVMYVLMEQFKGKYKYLLRKKSFSHFVEIQLKYQFHIFKKFLIWCWLKMQMFS